jgi:putative resolvase
MVKKLSQYANEHGVTYRTAWEHYRLGKIEGAHMDDTGHVVIPDSTPCVVPRAAIYARVSSSENKDNLEAQALRLTQYATARGWQVVEVVKEIGSGVNDHRKKLEHLLQGSSWNILVVEHKDRLTRFGFHYLDTLLPMLGKRIEVVNLAEDSHGNLMEDLVAVIYSFSARLYGLRRSRHTTQRIVTAIEGAAEAANAAGAIAKTNEAALP